MHFKQHPKYSFLLIRGDGGCVKYYGDTVFPKVRQPKKGIFLRTVCLNGTDYSLPKLIAETFIGVPDTKMYAVCKDKDYNNTHPSNIEWRKHPVSEKDKLKENFKISKLTKFQAIRCYIERTKNNVTLSTLSKRYNVSDMSIHRAVKRVEKHIAKTKK